MAGPNIRRLYYSATEVCTNAGVSPGTLRGWEVKFPNLKPARSQAGRRLYRPNDLALIKRIKRLKEIGYTDEKVAEMLFLSHQSEAPPIQPEPIFVSVPQSSHLLIPATSQIQENSQEILSDVNQVLKEILDLLDENTDEQGEIKTF